ncbi:hypothetical protein BDV26DRAFT_23341 [Aspergillus bertholletiae]|uniref:Uncharacterized protein n=1 Tax=Aspergillus bertholletiae TaxID=1226010 RepID=A0A5N7AZB3_9EURO|nr:hypothetical protein BDV26DRAFT_23341 [Aspergillus bertholletiae]
MNPNDSNVRLYPVQPDSLNRMIGKNRPASKRISQRQISFPPPQSDPHPLSNPMDPRSEKPHTHRSLPP